MEIEKIITEQDFFECSGGMMPSPFQSKQLKVYHKSGEKFITEVDISTLSWVDFGCKKVMLLYAVAAAVAALLAALVVGTGGTALIAICAIAGLAGAAWGAVIGTLICGQLVAPTREWLGHKGDFSIMGIKTINGKNYMICNAFTYLGMSPEYIKYNPNIKSWGQALAKGSAALIQNLFEGMMAGALIGTAGAAASGLASVGSSSFTMGGLGRGALQLGKNFAVNFIESFSTFGLGMRGVAGTQNVLATYGETGEMDSQTFDQAFSDGFWSPEIGAVESVQNIASGKGTWQDYGGIILMFSPVGESKREVLDGESPRVTVDADGLGNKVDDIAKNADEVPTKPRIDDVEATSKPTEDGVPIQKGKSINQLIKESQEAWARLQEKMNKMTENQQRKCFSCDEITTGSGYSDKRFSNKFTNEYDITTVHYDEVFNKANEYGYDDMHTNSSVDNGVEGSSSASHAEKQAMAKTDDGIAVSKKMCPCCEDFAQAKADKTGQPVVVTDPEATKVFKPGADSHKPQQIPHE